LGRKWYAIVKFFEWGFAQSELKDYTNFEKNYNTYSQTSDVAEEEEQPREEENHLKGSDSDDLEEPVSLMLQWELERQQQ
jgi:hypothetical protein